MKAAGAHFTAAESAHGCEGCLFEHERMTECHAASIEARRLDLPDCEDRSPSGGYIYILSNTDPRQMRIPTKE